MVDIPRDLKTIDAWLAETELFTKLIPDYQPRSTQVEMSGYVDHCLISRASALIDADSDFGKTLAYLLPLIYRGKQALIATATHAKQGDLLIHYLLPLQAVLPVAFSVAEIKGRHNYLCPYFLEKRLAGAESGAFFSYQQQQEFYRLLQHFYRRGEGDLSLLGVEKSELKLLSCSESRCLQEQCPDYNRCPYFKAHQRAESADIVVVNHHLLLSYCRASAKNYLAKAEVIVVDEVARFAAVVEQGERLSLHSNHLQRLLKALTRDIAKASIEDAAIRQWLVVMRRFLQYLQTEALPDHRSARALHRQKVRQLLGLLQQLARWLEVFAERSLALRVLVTENHQLIALLTRLQAQENEVRIDQYGHHFVIVARELSAEKQPQALTVRNANQSWIFIGAHLTSGVEREFPDELLAQLSLSRDQYRHFPKQRLSQ